MTFGDDLGFLKQYGMDVVLLTDSETGAQVAVSPRLQGRVLTSTAAGDSGISLGWINRELIASGKLLDHINAHGGEDRFWLGPEGGQYSIFFEKGVPFDLDHWFTPAQIDTEPFDVDETSGDAIMLEKEMRLANYSGTEFDLRVNRTVRLLDSAAAGKKLGLVPAVSINMVAYQSENKVTNIGNEPWQKETGLLSIWILGMYNPSQGTTIVLPYRSGDEKDLGPAVNDEYFGKVPAERLVVKDGVVFFRGDGKYRSKIGLTPQRAMPVMGSYDQDHGVLTIVQYSLHEGLTDYVNSMWEIQDQPYSGDAANSYNDGPPEPGAKPLGPFYELETSSPALALKTGESASHVHRTFHLQGGEGDLDPVAKEILGVTIAEIKSALP